MLSYCYICIAQSAGLDMILERLLPIVVNYMWNPDRLSGII